MVQNIHLNNETVPKELITLKMQNIKNLMNFLKCNFRSYFYTNGFDDFLQFCDYGRNILIKPHYSKFYLNTSM